VAEYYQVGIEAVKDGVTTLRLAFGAPALNDAIVRDALLALSALHREGGRGVRFNGPASLPVAMALSHAVAHLFGFVACFDPKLEKYVVAVSHDPSLKPGDLID